MKTALVTGASYGIGNAIAQVLLDSGWKVYGLSRTKPSLTSERFVWLMCDLGRTDQILQSMALITEPTLDALVSNAGVVIEEPASAVTVESYEQIFSINLLAPMLITSTLREKLTHAAIISVSSVSDRLPDSNMALYCSSKAANTQYFDALAQELKDARVYALLPDYVDTPMLRNSPPSDKHFNWGTTIKPLDIAKFATRLISEEVELESGANVIIVTDALKSSWSSVEKLYGFNTDRNELVKL